MHKLIQQILCLIFIWFFLCKVPRKKLETKMTDCRAEGKLDSSGKRMLYDIQPNILR